MKRAPRTHISIMPALLGVIVVLAIVIVIGFVARPAGPGTSGQSGVIRVMAAENFWGSVAAQLGGNRVKVTSIINNPDTDPHGYEPTAVDGRTAADAQYVIINGAGYDPWADKLLAASNNSAASLKIGDLVGVAPGGNPHRWYSPDNVEQVISRITADYKRLDPAAAGYFDAQKAAYERDKLKRYSALVDEIKAKYFGVPVGASESIFSPLAQSLGLNLITPAPFLAAMSEGADPTAADKAIVDHQITASEIKVYVYNSQNSTPDTTRQIDEARAAGIPIVTVTETLTPAGATFQDWQAGQLQDLRDALAEATGK